MTSDPLLNAPVAARASGWRIMARIWDGRDAQFTNRLYLVAGSLLLFALVLVVYRPILPGSFIMDDWHLIDTDNPLSNGELTPSDIWFQTDFTLSSFALWLEYLAWGNLPGWYHLVNLLLHGSSAVLIWWLLKKLNVRGAWLAGALYAVHPVCVNSVARIAEIKNTLSLPFFLLSFWAYLQYEVLALYPKTGSQRRLPDTRYTGTLWYVLAFLSFIAALLAKTSTVMLPFILIACAMWQRGRIGRKDCVHIAPFFMLSLAFGLMSVWFQKNQALFSCGLALVPETFWQRFAVAGHILGFYLAKALLPFNLNLVYPQWKIDATAFTSYLPHIAFCIGAIVCWRFRRSWGRHALFAFGCYVITLFPVLGFFDSQFLTIWQVSDHLQYLPLVAPVALTAACLGGLPNRNFFRLALLALLLGGAILSFQRASLYTSDEKLMRDSIAGNPSDWYARNELGVILARQNNFTEALGQFEAALKISPENAKIHSNLGHALALTGKPKEAEEHFKFALMLNPLDDSTHKNFADLLRREGRNQEAIIHYQAGLALKPDTPTRLSLAGLYYQTGEMRQAIDQCRQILRLEPNNVETLNNLAWFLATCGDESQRNGAEAVGYAEKACVLTGFKEARLTGTLAAAYAEAGRFPEAVATCRTTIKLADDDGEKNIAAIGNQLLTLYLNNMPYHSPLVPSNLGQ